MKTIVTAFLSKDGVHPNEKGYAVMEPLAKEAIRNSSNEKSAPYELIMERIKLTQIEI